MNLETIVAAFVGAIFGSVGAAFVAGLITMNIAERNRVSTEGIAFTDRSAAHRAWVNDRTQVLVHEMLTDVDRHALAVGDHYGRRDAVASGATEDQEIPDIAVSTDRIREHRWRLSAVADPPVVVAAAELNWASDRLGRQRYDPARHRDGGRVLPMSAEERKDRSQEFEDLRRARFAFLNAAHAQFGQGPVPETHVSVQDTYRE